MTSLKSRSLALCLVVIAWFTTTCVAMLPSHACCQQMANHLSAALPSCCAGQSIVQPAWQPASHGGDSGLWVSAPAFNPLDFLGHRIDSVNDSRLASALVPDQSDRYLELRVLLN